MPDVVLSDVHLRLDRPDRAARLARVVNALEPVDRLVVAGDLCDFWFASRQRDVDPRRCEGLTSLIRFRERGGELRVLLGNHDAWMGERYAAWFGVAIDPQPMRLASHGLRVEVAHGHLFKQKPRWKAWMEGRTFLEGFAALPNPAAAALERLLDAANERTRHRAELRMIDAYRARAQAMTDPPDLVVYGHVHRVVDEPGPPRLVVLGDWFHATRYLRIAGGVARHVDLPA